MASNVTRQERQQAIRMANDVVPVERAALIAAKQIGLEIVRRGITAFRKGLNPAESVGVVLDRSIRLLTDAMVMSHLFGVRRRQLDAPLSAGISPVFRESLAFLRQRMDLSADDILLLQVSYGPRATAVIDGVRRHIDSVVQRALVQTQLQGLSVRDGTKLLRKVFDETVGITKRNAYQIEAIFRTQTQMAYSAGNWNATRNDPEIDEILWGYKYVTVGDDRVRESHALIDGVTLKKDDEFWNRNFPPNGWNCRCQAIPIFSSRRQKQPPKQSLNNGLVTRVGADRGFDFNPGQVIRTQAA